MQLKRILPRVLVVIWSVLLLEGLLSLLGGMPRFHSFQQYFSSVAVAGRVTGEISQNQISVLVVGDSNVFDYAVDAENTYPTFLRELLQKKLGQNVHVEVGGAPGANAFVIRRDLEQRLSERTPDFVFVMLKMESGRSNNAGLETFLQNRPMVESDALSAVGFFRSDVTQIFRETTIYAVLSDLVRLQVASSNLDEIRVDRWLQTIEVTTPIESISIAEVMEAEQALRTYVRRKRTSAPIETRFSLLLMKKMSHFDRVDNFIELAIAHLRVALEVAGPNERLEVFYAFERLGEYCLTQEACKFHDEIQGVLLRAQQEEFGGFSVEKWFAYLRFGRLPIESSMDINGTKRGEFLLSAIRFFPDSSFHRELWAEYLSAQEKYTERIQFLIESTSQLPYSSRPDLLQLLVTMKDDFRGPVRKKIVRRLEEIKQRDPILAKRVQYYADDALLPDWFRAEVRQITSLLKMKKIDFILQTDPPNKDPADVRSGDAVLRNFCDDEQVLFLDSARALERKFRESGVSRINFYGLANDVADSHLSALGNKMLAEIAVDFLDKNGKLEKLALLNPVSRSSDQGVEKSEDEKPHE